jgi:hypothetical protein
VLQLMVGGAWLPAASLHLAGPSTIVRLLGKGWMERKQNASFGWAYRITKFGRAAIEAPVPSKAHRSAETRQVNDRKLWTPQDDERVYDLALSGLRKSEIATQLGRSTYSIKNRAQKLRILINRSNTNQPR